MMPFVLPDQGVAGRGRAADLRVALHDSAGPVEFLFHFAPVDAEFAAEGAAGDAEKVGGLLVVAFGLGERGKDRIPFEAFEAEAVLDDRRGAASLDARWEVRNGDFVVSSGDDGAADCIAELADVAGPGISAKRG